MSIEPNKVIYSMIGVSKYYDKRPILKDIYLVSIRKPRVLYLLT